MAGLYLHIPFCKQACYYCDFHFSTNQEVRSELVNCLVKEIELQQNYLSSKAIDTIYFGGGTPSLLPADELNALINTIEKHFSVSANAEITLEANPDDLTSQKLQELKSIGVNRLSIGIQSFHNEFLTFLHRAHNASTAIQCVDAARKAGFENISIDLIYGMPNESETIWLKDIEQAIALSPEHISCYSLTIEEKTVFGRWAASGKLSPAADEVAARHLELLMERLTKAGYEHYEISNFARPGFYSRHNTSYWQQHQYLGIGPSAHSYNGVSRQFNISNNHLYIKSLQQGVVPFEKEVLSREDLINEYLLTSLRTHWGANVLTLKEHYAYDVLAEDGEYIQSLLEQHLAILKGEHLVLTNKGKLLADKISSDLFILPS